MIAKLLSQLLVTNRQIKRRRRQQRGNRYASNFNDHPYYDERHPEYDRDFRDNEDDDDDDDQTHYQRTNLKGNKSKKNAPSVTAPQKHHHHHHHTTYKKNEANNQAKTEAVNILVNVVGDGMNDEQADIVKDSHGDDDIAHTKKTAHQMQRFTVSGVNLKNITIPMILPYKLTPRQRMLASSITHNHHRYKFVLMFIFFIFFFFFILFILFFSQFCEEKMPFFHEK